MLNAEDALGLQEDLAIIRAHRNRARAEAFQASVPQATEVLETMAVAKNALRANRDTINGLRADLDKITSNRNDVAAIARSAREVVAVLADEIARLKGIDPQIAQERANRLLSRRYDAHIDALMQHRALEADPREDAEAMKIRAWYVAANELGA
ncbi:hypothetical protein [Ralstonia pseudosolanacearum]|uniref:hypothetical protein n=1 Tax=Ralstonia pseudosolanacearum TaxID=1310165 RepID=UPI000AD9CCBB|nr:hypothetical protein [Ralstonia pseudosolanacearum]